MCTSEIISVQGIEKHLEPQCSGLDVEVYPSLVSTNTTAGEKAANGTPEGCVIIANAQTGGKGRLGRSFYSPSDTGVYLSLILRPENCLATQAVKITTMAAVAVCEAIETVSGQKAQIKWVNDIFMDGKKVCGILTEAAFDSKGNFLEYAVLGIGINVFPPEGGFPDEIKDIAGAVFAKAQSDGKNRIAAEILNRFMKYYEKFPQGDYIQHYRERCFVIGKEVRVLSTGEQRNATVLDVDDQCGLVVRFEDGKVDTLSSGEISVRL